LCSKHHVLMIVDEIFSGFARTGKWFAFEHSGIVPDLVTIGKALSGGFPISACVGTREAMSHWPRHEGEALHSSTFMAHPIGCAMSLASIGEIRQKKLIQKARQKGKILMARLQDMARRYVSIGHVRGAGLMIGLEIICSKDQSPDAPKAFSIAEACLKNGLILLSDGIHKNVLSLTPPLVIDEKLIEKGVGILEKCIAKAEA
jgi:4-aminobutyrate aminotransferase/(S)-3-amino-2-methylpropionate transaminase